MPEEAIFIAAAVLATACVLVVIYRRATRRAQAEQGLTPQFETRCMFRYGRFGTFFGGNMPAFRLAIYEEFVVLSGLTQQVIRYSQISEVKRGFLGEVAIAFQDRGAAHLVRFSCRANSRILELLRQHVRCSKTE